VVATEEAQAYMVRFFMYYNRTKLHSYNDYLSPVATEKKAALTVIAVLDLVDQFTLPTLGFLAVPRSGLCSAE